ncbi:hypothetical protein, partial [Methanoregula sp.]|uniref:hypothetical protein n=1 Tax=Methanoregula sp. TaxID=2052170 RepID=UPI002603B143
DGEDEVFEIREVIKPRDGEDEVFESWLPGMESGESGALEGPDWRSLSFSRRAGGRIVEILSNPHDEK